MVRRPPLLRRSPRLAVEKNRLLRIWRSRGRFSWKFYSTDIGMKGKRLCTGGNFVWGLLPPPRQRLRQPTDLRAWEIKNFFFYAEIDCPKSFADKTRTVGHERSVRVRCTDSKHQRRSVSGYYVFDGSQKRYPNSTKHGHYISNFFPKELNIFFRAFPADFLFFHSLVFLLVLPLSVWKGIKKQRRRRRKGGKEEEEEEEWRGSASFCLLFFVCLSSFPSSSSSSPLPFRPSSSSSFSAF